MSELTFTSALHSLGAATREMARHQLIDQAHHWHGAYISPVYGLADAGASGSSALAACLGLLLAADAASTDRDDLLQRFEAMTAYLLRAQRPSGLIDLYSANYDSAPDAAFAVQVLAAMYEQAHGTDPALGAALENVETFIRRAVAGILTGGFHTPNHRWVICSALAQAAALFADLDVREVVESYLAEGFDIDAEGTYIERSVGVYDAVTNRSLLLLADRWPDAAVKAAAYAAVQANLDFDLHLLHADGTAETGLSRRQDYGTRTVPAGLIACYLHSAVRSDNAIFASAARWLWAQAKQPGDFWAAYVLQSVGAPTHAPIPLPTAYTRLYPLNRVWRARRGLLSASAFAGGTRLLTVVYGAAELASLKISQSYFGVGHFAGDEIETDGDSVLLRSRGDHFPYRPAYELPLGRPVPPDRWDALKAERTLNWVPRADSILRLTPVEGGLDLHYRTLDGMDDVTAQVALDFPAGGIWETDDTALVTQPGQIIFLKAGAGRMRFGHDSIEISPGSNAHRTWHMRDTEPAGPGMVRVLLPLLAPVDYRFRLRVYTTP